MVGEVAKRYYVGHIFLLLVEHSLMDPCQALIWTVLQARAPLFFEAICTRYEALYVKESLPPSHFMSHG